MSKDSHALLRIGAIGALLDEYEKAVVELRQLINTFSDEELTLIIDPNTKDEDCRSVQSVLSHVIRSGFCYFIYMRNSQGENLSFIDRKELTSVHGYDSALEEMFKYSEEFVKDYPNIELETFEQDRKIKTAWNQFYDVEQLFEHAIVHVLRHRRQLERFKKMLPIV